MNIIIGTRGVWRNGSLSRRRCADGLEHMCSQGRLFATPITGTSNKFRPRQRRLRGPTHGKWEESLLQHSSRRFQLAAESKVVHCQHAVIVSPTDERLKCLTTRDVTTVGTMRVARLTLCAYVYARSVGNGQWRVLALNIVISFSLGGSITSIAVRKFHYTFQAISKTPFFPPSRMRRKNGLVQTLKKNGLKPVASRDR